MFEGKMGDLSDEDLYLQLSDKPEWAFRLLYDRYSAPLFRFIYRFTGNSPSAEDILHDIFLQLLNRKFQLAPEANLKGWLYTVAKNKSLNHLKKSAKEFVNQDIISNEQSDSNLESETIDRNNIKKLAFAMNALPVDLKATWELRRQGLDYRQIAHEKEFTWCRFRKTN